MIFFGSGAGSQSGYCGISQISHIKYPWRGSWIALLQADRTHPTHLSPSPRSDLSGFVGRICRKQRNMDWESLSHPCPHGNVFFSISRSPGWSQLLNSELLTFLCLLIIPILVYNLNFKQILA